MVDQIVITVNGTQHKVQAAPNTPLLYVLRNELGLHGPQFGCGLEQCGSCMVIYGREAKQSCKLTVSDVGQTPIITLEGLMEDGQLHPVQEAFIEEQAAQCGFCTNGMIIATAALLIKVHNPSERVIRETLDGNLCRCGSHLRIIRAVQRAAELMWKPGE
jgi:aerobic-type carbon monoxide dehydrogenase small subunit (CoxS/CutS family)